MNPNQQDASRGKSSVLNDLGDLDIAFPCRNIAGGLCLLLPHCYLPGLSKFHLIRRGKIRIWSDGAGKEVEII